MPRVSLAAATAEVARRDRTFSAVIGRAGPIRFRPAAGDPFAALARAIVYQQLAGRAAEAIHGRFVALFDGRPTPQAVLASPHASLRAAGLSEAKALAIRDLAQKAADGSVPLDRLGRMDDDDIVAAVTPVRGIGRWTAEMYLIFELHRRDVWPVDDLAVRAGYGLVHAVPAPKPGELLPLGDRYRPYRTIAAWYCWRAVHLSRGAP